MNSPGSMHLPPSPFAARHSTASPSSFIPQPPQNNVHYSTGLQMPQSPAPGVLAQPQVHPTSPGSVYNPRMGQMGPPQHHPFSYHSQVQPQWVPQSQSHYVGQPQVMGSSGPTQRVMVQRIPYPAPGFSPSMPPSQPAPSQQPPGGVVYSQGNPPSLNQPQPHRAIYPQASQQLMVGQQNVSNPPHYSPGYYQTKSQNPYPHQIYRQQASSVCNIFVVL
ncbi:hypothetical protein AB6A40_011140 [Gnathostoma spinigerum]|uniref:Uncharacterized protein n=1 Tax=Gnathostoma spinigerum TaxID=75299 RepID=A0ABD6F2G5_9BILA